MKKKRSFWRWGWHSFLVFSFLLTVHSFVLILLFGEPSKDQFVGLGMTAFTAFSIMFLMIHEYRVHKKLHELEQQRLGKPLD